MADDNPAVKKYLQKSKEDFLNKWDERSPVGLLTSSLQMLFKLFLTVPRK